MSALVGNRLCTNVIDLDFDTDTDSDSEDDLIAALKSNTRMSASFGLGSTHNNVERGDSSPLSSAPSELDPDDAPLIDSYMRDGKISVAKPAGIKFEQTSELGEQDNFSRHITFADRINAVIQEDERKLLDLPSEKTSTGRRVHGPQANVLEGLLEQTKSTVASTKSPYHVYTSQIATQTTSRNNTGMSSTNESAQNDNTSITMKNESSSEGDHEATPMQARELTPPSSPPETNDLCSKRIDNKGLALLSAIEDQGQIVGTAPAPSQEISIDTVQQPFTATHDSEEFTSHSKDRRTGFRSTSQDHNSEDDLKHKTITPPSSIKDQAEVGDIVPTQEDHEMVMKASFGAEILAAVASSNRKAMKAGDLAIILDVDDLSKTILVSSDKLFGASKVLKESAARQPTSKGAKQSQEGIQYIFLIEANKDAISLPKARLIIVRSHDDLKDETEYKAYSRVVEAAKTPIKQEDEDVQDNLTAESVIRHDWLEGYYNFVSIITAVQPARRPQILFGPDAASVLPHIEAVVEIAKYLEALPEVRASLKALFYSYVSNCTLYKAVSVEAASWLQIGVDAEDPGLYQEAFKHVAGRYPEWPWQNLETSVPANVLTAIKKKSLNLLHFRDSVNVELLTQWTVVQPNYQAQQGSAAGLCFLGFKANMVKWHVVSVWHQWMIDHINYLKDVAPGEINADPKQSSICKHVGGKCLTDAGLYYTISKAGDAYLTVDEVLAIYKDRDRDNTTVRDTLRELKSKAAEIVAPLAQSTLHYGGKDETKYLTCVEVEPEDMPWSQDEEDIDV